MTDSPIYQTPDFVVEVGTSDAVELPSELKRIFFIRHRSTGVVHGRTNQLADALYGSEIFQRELDRAKIDPKNRPERPLSQYEQAALLGAIHGGGAGN
jgi:hypothetical protein